MMDLREFISASKPSRMIGKPGHEGAKNYLLQKIQEIDPTHKGEVLVEKFDPEVDTAKKMYRDDLMAFKATPEAADPMLLSKNQLFTDHMVQTLDQMKSIPGQNLFWLKPGKKNDWIVLSANYDTISHDPNTLMIKSTEAMPGADYNGSGVVIALNLIRTLKDLNLDTGVIVAFWDYSTLGFLGSHHFLNHGLKTPKVTVTSSQLKLHLHFLMLGYDSKSVDSEKKQGNMKIYYSKEKKEESFITEMKKGTLNKKLGVEFTPDPNGFNQGDHVKFWDKGIPSLVFSQNWETDFNHRNYQTPHDLPETVNAQTLEGVLTWLTYGIVPLLKTSP
jgi:hypothetical protein